MLEQKTGTHVLPESFSLQTPAPNIFGVKVYELKIAKMILFHGLMKKTESEPHKFKKRMSNTS